MRRTLARSLVPGRPTPIRCCGPRAASTSCTPRSTRRHGLLAVARSDGRVFFVVPFGGRIVWSGRPRPRSLAAAARGVAPQARGGPLPARRVDARAAGDRSHAATRGDVGAPSAAALGLGRRRGVARAPRVRGSRHHHDRGREVHDVSRHGARHARVHHRASSASTAVRSPTPAIRCPRRSPPASISIDSRSSRSSTSSRAASRTSCGVARRLWLEPDRGRVAAHAHRRRHGASGSAGAPSAARQEFQSYDAAAVGGGDAAPAHAAGRPRTAPERP